MVSSLTFKSLIHFECILLVCGVRRWPGFIFLHLPVQFSQHHLLNQVDIFELFLVHWMENEEMQTPSLLVLGKPLLSGLLF